MTWTAASKRFGVNMERLPPNLRRFFENFQLRGQIPAMRSDLPTLPENKRLKTMEDWKFAVGDQVLIMKGKLKGTITKIVKLQPASNGFYLEDGPTKKIVIPKEYWNQTQDSHVMDYPKVVDRSYFKLLGTVEDPNTKQKKYIAANDIVLRGKYWDENYKKMLPYRCIKNKEDIRIPWPKPEPIEDDAYCTPEAKVMERTYFPTSIVLSELPADLKDSLRPPLSKSSKSKYDKYYLRGPDIKRLTKPNMPIPEHLRKLREEKELLKNKKALKLTPEIEDFIGKKVADHLNKNDNPHIKAYIEKVSGDNI
ncbi:hypothetical protein PACTADRAFT_47657 [Pachysolen tannophilus NRRL Y-2460]|uniref:KOW domain-containing protein n=1 Tax=Pachysolen tannophilus NRRL Y-2460 TaxID=669874 RepID=A0A1E4U1B9_PACTA|nr:hypothetical protein PACTADRAFT_47657 [Pachysolen tannophilus NRRL Y-2460]